MASGQYSIRIISRDTEAKLVEMMESIREDANSWRALYFHFSQLLEHYKSDYQIKIAVNLVSDLLKDCEGSVFICADFDIFVLAKGANKGLLDKVVFQLRYLFMDDPFAYSVEGNENPDFCTLYDLSVDKDTFIDVCKKKLADSAKYEVAASLHNHQSMAQGMRSGEIISRHIRPMTPHRLAAVEEDLRPADLSRVLRRQPICAAKPGKPIRRVFDELYINISHLRQVIMADVDFTSNHNLFQYLTQLLDEKVLELLRRHSSQYLDMPVSINLNVATLLSDKFAEFDALIKPSTKVSVVIELQVSDVFSDMEAFLVARKAVQKSGYRVCLDGLTPLSFTQVSREQLGFDLAKLQWNADAESDLDSPENRALAKAVKKCGANRVILCRCDSRQAIDYGQGMDISLFQGRFLDKVINPNAKVEN